MAALWRAEPHNALLLQHYPALLQRKVELVLLETPSDPQLFGLLEELRPIARNLQPAWAVSHACLIAWHFGLYAEVSGPPLIGSTSIRLHVLCCVLGFKKGTVEPAWPVW